jgi:hypothetical protein
MEKSMKKLATGLLVMSISAIAYYVGLRPLVGQGAENSWGGSREERSPFTDVRWHGAVPEVKVDKTWYELAALNDVSAQRIVDACRAADPKDWKKRFEEDLVAVLKRIDVTCGETVELKVKDLKSARVQTLDRVPMTKQNRQQIVKARLEQAGRLKPDSSKTP